MSTGRFTALIGAALLAGSLAACTDETAGNPAPPGESPTIIGGTEVPKVANPLDATPFLKNPCALVDTKTLKDLGTFGPGEPDVDSREAKNLFGPGCEWSHPDLEGPTIQLAIRTVHQEKAEDNLKGIGGIYANGPGKFEPTEIPGHAGYPAALRTMRENWRSECTVSVGIRDDLTFDVGLALTEDGDDNCPITVAVAADVLDHLKKGA